VNDQTRARIDSARHLAVEQAMEVSWALRRFWALFAGVVVVLGGAFIALQVQPAKSDPTRAAVEDAADALRIDFATGVESLAPVFVRQFAGIEDGDMVGTVARRGGDGTCWGFTVTVPGSWLADGTGAVAVGTVDQLSRDACID
jgi:hypothetical protein